MQISSERFDVPLKNDGTRRLVATDIAQQQRLNNCQRFLRWRLFENNAGSAVMNQLFRRYNLALQSPTPLPAVVGQQFEQRINHGLPAFGWPVESFGHTEAVHNQEFVQLIQALPRGHGVFLLQPNFEVVIADWTLAGRPDIVRAYRDVAGNVQMLITDIKSAFTVKPEHQLQVGIYHVILEAILGLQIPCHITTSIMHQIPPAPSADSVQQARIDTCTVAAKFWYGLDTACLDVVANPLELRDSVQRMLAYDSHSLLQQSTNLRFADIPYAICRNCEGCAYMELCLTDSNQRQDIALVPLLDRESRTAFVKQGIHTVAQLATVKQVNSKNELVTPTPTPTNLIALGNDALLGTLLDEWIARAQRLHNASDRATAVAYLPASMRVTLPRISGNAAVLYLDIQSDHLAGFVWHCGALIDYYVAGKTTAQYPVSLQASNVPDLVSEGQLLGRWLRQITISWNTHIYNTDMTHTVPLHFVVYEHQTWLELLAALGRHYDTDPVIRAWHDFLTTPRPHDAPIVTVVSNEVNATNRLSTTIPSLMALASINGFPWADAQYNYRSLFHAFHFDASGRSAPAEGYYSQRARYSSNIPLEYAYAAWQRLPAPTQAKSDALAHFRHITPDVLGAYCRYRLCGLMHLTTRVGRWWHNQAEAVHLGTIAQTHAAPTQLHGALVEYMHAERHAQLYQWVDTHTTWPTARVRANTALIVEYRDEWQSAATLRKLDHARRLNEAALAPMNGIQLAVRICSGGELPDFAQQITSSPFVSEVNTALLAPLLTESHKPLTPAQLIHGSMRVKLSQIHPPHDLGSSIITLEPMHSRHTPPYVYGGRSLVPSDGNRYVLDNSPDNAPASVTNKALQQVITAPKDNWLYRMLSGDAPVVRGVDPLGLQAYVAACDIVGPLFGGAARDYVASYARVPLLLVQGPPGTGKTFTTAHAIMARIYAAMIANQPLRVAVSCHTHAAISELITKFAQLKNNLSDVGHAMARELQQVGVFRYRKNDSEVRQLGVTYVADKEQMLTHINQQQWCVVGATPTSIAALADGGAWGDLLILDEASQMSVPQAIVAAQVLAAEGTLIVVGDPRQMPVIVAHDWANEPRRSFVRYPVYRSLFDYLTDESILFGQNVPVVRLDTSYRVPAILADFLRHEIYRHDAIAYHSLQPNVMAPIACRSGLVQAALHADFPLILIQHSESQSRASNLYEATIVRDILLPLIAHNYDATSGYGVVVPHRLQRSTIKTLLRPHMPPAAGQLFADGEVQGVDTVERYQGSERDVMIVSATESDPSYIRQNEQFLFDVRRLNVALSRAKHKVIMVAATQIFDHIAHDATTQLHAQSWKNYRQQWCTVLIWAGEYNGHFVWVRGASRIANQNPK